MIVLGIILLIIGCLPSSRDRLDGRHHRLIIGAVLTIAVRAGHAISGRKQCTDPPRQIGKSGEG